MLRSCLLAKSTLRKQQRWSAAAFNLLSRSFSASAADHVLCVDALRQRAMRDRKTKIVCTIGPKSAPQDSLNALLHAGMNVLRLNCSHGDHDFYREVIGTLADCLENVRQSKRIDFSDGSREDICAVALDTKGPEIRTGVFSDDVVASSKLREVHIERGSEVKLHCVSGMQYAQTSTNIWCDYHNLPNIVKPGNKIFIDDGLLSLRVTSTHGTSVTCIAENSSLLGERKGVNLPGVSVDLPAVSAKDRLDLEFAREDKRVDFIFASFIRSADNVKEIRKIVGPDVRIISKIENEEGVDNIDEIIAESDGIMVARGDLGIEIPPERVFLVQKMILAKCNVAGKPAICATQMLESMTKNPRPTRAECGDVANAVLDGSDAVMLSGETAKGNFAQETVKIMSRTCQAAEAAMDYHTTYEFVHRHTNLIGSKCQAEALVSAAVSASFDEHAAMIVVITESGATAQTVAKYRPEAPILAMTCNKRTARMLQLYRGAQVILMPKPEGNVSTCGLDVEMVVEKATASAREMQIVSSGDRIIVISSSPGDNLGPNVLRIVTVA